MYLGGSISLQEKISDVYTIFIACNAVKYRWYVSGTSVMHELSDNVYVYKKITQKLTNDLCIGLNVDHSEAIIIIYM